MNRSARRGFTLLEVVVALMLSGFVAIGVHDVFVVMADDSSRITAAGRDLDADANEYRFIRALVASVEFTGSTDTEFGGDSAAVAFSAWCATSHGWSERCRASLTLEPAADATQLVVRLSTGGTFDVLTASRGAQLRYLSDVASGGQWLSRWASGTLVPRAIGVVTGRDTVILRIGDRG